MIPVVCSKCSWTGERSFNGLHFGCPQCRGMVVRVTQPAQEQPLIDLERYEDIPDGAKSERVIKLEMIEQAAQLGIVTREPQIVKRLLRLTTATLRDTLLKIEKQLEDLAREKAVKELTGSAGELAGGIQEGSVSETRARERLGASEVLDC